MGIINATNLISKILNTRGKHFVWAVSQNSDHETNKISDTGKIHFIEFYEELLRQIDLNMNIQLKHERYQIDLQEHQFTSSDGSQKPYLLFGKFFEVK